MKIETCQWVGLKKKLPESDGWMNIHGLAYLPTEGTFLEILDHHSSLSKFIPSAKRTEILGLRALKDTINLIKCTSIQRERVPLLVSGSNLKMFVHTQTRQLHCAMGSIHVGENEMKQRELQHLRMLYAILESCVPFENNEFSHIFWIAR